MKNEILDELWKVKDQLAKENDYDIEKLVKGLREDIRFFIKAFQKPVLKEETENGNP